MSAGLAPADALSAIVPPKRLLNAAAVLVALAVSALVTRHFLRSGWPIHHANPWLVALAAVTFLAAYGAKAWGWQRLFHRDQAPAMLTLAAAGGAASVGGLALPGRCDEVIRVAVVRRCRRRRASFGAVALSLFLLGLLDSAALSPLAAVALTVTRVGTWMTIGLAIVAVAGVAAAAWVAVVASWTLRGVAIFVLFGALGLGTSFALALAFLCASSASAVLPVAPAGAATQAGAGAAILAASGMSVDEAIAFGIAAQALVMAAGAVFVAALAAWHAQARWLPNLRVRRLRLALPK
jgi:hypothetical protein